MPIHHAKNDELVVLITIDRPESKNSLNLYHFRDLAAAWREFGEDDDAWTVIVTGVGQNFMSGANLKTYIPQITDLQKKIATGSARVAAYSVVHDHQGPTWGVAICDLPEGDRCYARVDDPRLMQQMEATEWVGRDVELLDGGNGVNRIEA